MKKKTNIKTLIRQIVREEVAMAINEVITELKQPTQQVSQPKPKKKIVEKKKKQFTKNSVINETEICGDSYLSVKQRILYVCQNFTRNISLRFHQLKCENFFIRNFSC